MSLTVNEIREYAKDIPELNILLQGTQQSSDQLIGLCMKLAVSDINGMPPITKFTVDTCPDASLMLYGTLHHLANGEAERQLRNQVNYSAQGVNAGIDDKFPQYSQLSQYYRQLFNERLGPFKQYINQDQAWGGDYSPYAALNEYKFRSDI